jgi:HAE1 family hydrophobic/amphiphilic exporter-1
MNGKRLRTVLNGRGLREKNTKLMRLFDELTGIKQAWRLMQPKQLLFVLLAGYCTLRESLQNANAAGPVWPTPDSEPPLYMQATNITTTNVLGVAETRKTRSLTIEDCIQLALEHNLDIQIQRLNPVINQYGLNVTYGVYEPTATFTGTKSYNDFPSGAGINPSTGLPYLSNVGEADSYSPSIAGVLPTGLSYDLTANTSRNIEQGFPNPIYGSPLWSSEFNLALKQPLLKNLWIDGNRLQIQLNKATLKISEQAFRLQVMTSVTAVKSAYYNLLYARGNVEANAKAYELAEQLVRENLKRVQVGSLAPLDERQSESQAAASLAAMQAAQQALVVQENLLKNLLTDNYSDWAEVTLLPSEQLIAVPQELNLQESWRRAVAQRPELIEAKLNVQKQNVTLKYDFNQIFPELDVIGSYGRNAIENTLGSSLDDIRQGDHSAYSYGAFMSIPLGGNYSGRNQYKSGKVSLKQLLLTLKQTEQGIVVAVDNDVGNVRSTLQQVDATRDARIYAEQALDAERKKLENGKSTSFIVLQLISNLTTAKVNEIQALATYNIAVAQLALDDGSTLEANHIDLKLR